MIKQSLIAILMLTILAASASAVVLVYESFDYTVGENLDDQTDWNGKGTTTEEAVIASGNLGASGFEIPVGNQVRLYPDLSSNSGTRKEIVYDADGRASGEALYISFLLNVSDVGTLSTNNFRFLCYYRANDYNGLAIRQHSGDTAKFDIALGKKIFDSPDAVVWDENGGRGYSEGSTILVVYGVDDVSTSGATDLKCWINPDPSTFGSSAPAPTMLTEARAALGGNGDVFSVGHGNGATVTIDELRIGESYAEVTPGDSTVRATYILID